MPNYLAGLNMVTNSAERGKLTDLWLSIADTANAVGDDQALREELKDTINGITGRFQEEVRQDLATCIALGSFEQAVAMRSETIALSPEDASDG